MFISVPNLPWLPEEHCLQAMVSRADAVQILPIKVVKDLSAFSGSECATPYWELSDGSNTAKRLEVVAEYSLHMLIDEDRVSIRVFGDEAGRSSCFSFASCCNLWEGRAAGMEAAVWQ